METNDPKKETKPAKNAGEKPKPPVKAEPVRNEAGILSTDDFLKLLSFKPVTDKKAIDKSLVHTSNVHDASNVVILRDDKKGFHPGRIFKYNLAYSADGVHSIPKGTVFFSDLVGTVLSDITHFAVLPF